MSWMLLRLESRVAALAWRMKYFCAWLATCVGVRVLTANLEMFLQSPRPYFSSPSRNSLRKHAIGNNKEESIWREKAAAVGSLAGRAHGPAGRTL